MTPHMSSALNRQTQLLCKKLPEAYTGYNKGISQQKIVYGIKRFYQSRTLFGFKKGAA